MNAMPIPEQNTILIAAQAYARAGLSIIPDRQDSKAPAIAWGEFQRHKATDWQIKQWFPRFRIGIVCGFAGVEMIDFDNGAEQFEAWRALIGENLFNRLVIETTLRNGRHVVYRCPTIEIPGNQKLSERMVNGTGEIQTLIETRGSGGQFLCAPNPGYTLIQGDFTALPVLTVEERETLINAARSLNEYEDPIPENPTLAPSAIYSSTDDSPADEYNATHEFRDILAKRGWLYSHTLGKREYYTRPGKEAKEGISASVTDGVVLYVFSSNARPFLPNTGYSKFQTFAMLEHNGDMSAAALAVVKARPPANHYRPVLQSVKIDSAGEATGVDAASDQASTSIESDHPALSNIESTAAAIQQWMNRAVEANKDHDNGDGLPKPINMDSLLDFVPANDSASILGKRWLCESGSLLLIGQAGIGKSTLSVQAGITWSFGKSFFGINPRAKLRSLFIQAENDDGDIAEMIQGVTRGIGLNTNDPELRSHLRSNLVIVRDSTRTGAAFCKMAELLIEQHKPDLVFADPLLSYVGGDLGRQEVCSTFLRNNLNPVLQRTRVGWIWCHHTGKPPKDADAMKNWTDADYSYLGIGSSDLTNWARSIGVIIKDHATDPIYKLVLTKRGKRAGLKSIDGADSTSITLEHSANGQSWIQRLPIIPERTEKPDKPDAKYVSPKETEEKKKNFEQVLKLVKANPCRFGEVIRLIEVSFGCKTSWAKLLMKDLYSMGLAKNSNGLWTDTRETTEF